MYAYLDASNDVVAMSSTEYTLAQAQAAIPSVTQIIVDAPQGLLIKGQQTAAQPYWHRHSTGDGSMLSHYISVEELGPLKTQRMNEIDARTDQLFEQGFQYPPDSGKVFSLSVRSQLKITNAWLARDEPGFTYPVRWNTRDNTDAHEMADATALNAFYMTAIGTARAYCDSGTALKDQIRAATTSAEVNAVVDNR